MTTASQVGCNISWERGAPRRAAFPPGLTSASSCPGACSARLNFRAAGLSWSGGEPFTKTTRSLGSTIRQLLATFTAVSMLSPANERQAVSEDSGLWISEASTGLGQFVPPPPWQCLNDTGGRGQHLSHATHSLSHVGS